MVYRLHGEKNEKEISSMRMRTITCFGGRKLRLCCHPRWLALEVRVVIVSSDINSSFLAKFRFPVREYMRRCNAVENIYIHKGIGLRDRVIFSS